MDAMIRHLLVAGLAAALLGAACQPAPPPPELLPTPSATPEPPSALNGQLVGGDPADAAGRGVALCALRGEACTLLPETTQTDEAGQFTFEDVAAGRYLLLTDSGLADFDEAAADRAGDELHPGDWPWVRDELLGLAEGDPIELHVSPDAGAGRVEYALNALLLGESPFVVAHEAAPADSLPARPLVIDVGGGESTTVDVPLRLPDAPDYDALRAAQPALTNEERALLEPTTYARWAAFSAGDDSAYRSADYLTVAALRAGSLHRIGGTYFSAVQTAGDRLVLQPGYALIDPQSGEATTAAWFDPASGDVIEAATGYQLNVRDAPGVRVDTGPAGEQMWRYGFSYYPRWEQILPDPIIRLAEDFYTQGLGFVSYNLDDYREAAEAFGGDLADIDWGPRTQVEMWEWRPVTAPFVRLPDSGTVDIRRERFLRAMIDGAVVVDSESVTDFLRSEAVQGSVFNQQPTRQEVVEALLIPYRSGHLFSDLEAAIILDATYGPNGDPLTIRISSRLDQGFHVPRYQDKEVLVAPGEVANVLLGYPGALNSRWPHEMAHIVEFRSPQYNFTERPAVGSRCEPAKYLMEFMWWVKRYPGDAPDWDWLPINSGLTLARLLTEQYHNSGC